MSEVNSLDKALGILIGIFLGIVPLGLAALTYYILTQLNHFFTNPLTSQEINTTSTLSIFIYYLIFTLFVICNIDDLAYKLANCFTKHDFDTLFFGSPFPSDELIETYKLYISVSYAITLLVIIAVVVLA